MPHQPQPPDGLTELIVSIAPKLHAFRIDNNQIQPVTLRNIATWNVGEWTQPGRAGDEKLRAVRASLKQAPWLFKKHTRPMNKQLGSSHSSLAYKSSLRQLTSRRRSGSTWIGLVTVNLHQSCGVQ